jgi:hypothetical protein
MNSHDFGLRLSNALHMEQTLLLSRGTVIVPLKTLRDLDAGMCVMMLNVYDMTCVTPTFRDTKFFTQPGITKCEYFNPNGISEGKFMTIRANTR